MLWLSAGRFGTVVAVEDVVAQDGCFGTVVAVEDVVSQCRTLWHCGSCGGCGGSVTDALALR
jgi:hypothetical protein